MKYAIAVVLCVVLCAVVYSEVIGIEVPGSIAPCVTCGAEAKIVRDNGGYRVKCTTDNCWRGPVCPSMNQAQCLWNAVMDRP